MYLAAGVIAVPLFRRAGLGSVLGYLVAGMAIGPWGLRLISSPDTVLQFAELGVVMLLFLIGLELEPRRLWQMRRPIFGMGALQVLATAQPSARSPSRFGAALPIALVAGMGIRDVLHRHRSCHAAGEEAPRAPGGRRASRAAVPRLAGCRCCSL